MSKVPVLNYPEIIKALQRAGWVIIRQKRSHIRLQKHDHGEILKLTVPAHKPVKRSTLAHINKKGKMTLEEFLSAL